jgi:hypothetical protein
MDEQPQVLVPEQKSANKHVFNPEKPAEHLKPYWWQPGKSGNPNGRPKKLITEATREWLAKVDETTGLTNAQMVARAQGEQALKGETPAYNAIADRTEGKVPQPLSGDVDGEPIRVEFVGFAARR